MNWKLIPAILLATVAVVSAQTATPTETPTNTPTDTPTPTATPTNTDTPTPLPQPPFITDQLQLNYSGGLLMGNGHSPVTSYGGSGPCPTPNAVTEINPDGTVICGMTTPIPTPTGGAPSGKTVWMGGSGLNQLTAAGTIYFSNMGHEASATETFVDETVPVSGYIKNLYCHINAVTGTGNTYTFTQRYAPIAAPTRVNTTLTCAISHPSLDCNDLSNVVPVYAGDLVDISSVPASNPTPRRGQCSVEFDPVDITPTPTATNTPTPTPT